MRITVFVIAGLQAALILAALMSVLFGDNDPAGRALGSAYTTLAALAFRGGRWPRAYARLLE